jgi:hyperosmotically inducible protein
MKTKFKIVINASAVSLLTIAALAQETPTPNRKTDESDYTRNRAVQTRKTDRPSGTAKSSEIIGMTVKNYQDVKLGKVEELAVDVESGRILQVILSTGGLIGIGDTLTAVPPGALHHDVVNKVLHLNADKEKLKNAPKFEMTKWAQCCDSNHLSEVYRYYGQEPSFTFIRKGDGDLNRLRNTDPSANPLLTRKADGTWENPDMIPESRLNYLQKASKLRGLPVKNLQDEKLGKVDNIILDLPAGRIVAMIVSSGGFLGMGDELSAIPPTAFRLTTPRSSTDLDSLQLDASKETLSSAPHFKANQWPDFDQPSYVYGVYRAYRVEPYSTNFIADADNTARNIRDRFDRTVTPLDQGNSQADLDTTAQIRKEIVANKNLSVNARNVKVITNNGRVTLRGPVNSNEEKRIIAEIAARIAGPDNVDNQLEVKFSTSSSK